MERKDKLKKNQDKSFILDTKIDFNLVFDFLPNIIIIYNLENEDILYLNQHAILDQNVKNHIQEIIKTYKTLGALNQTSFQFDQEKYVISSLLFKDDSNKLLFSVEKQDEFPLKVDSMSDNINLLSDMSHEIRTPTNAIMGFAKLLDQTELSLLQQDYLDKIIHASDHLMQIVNNVLDYAKLEAGKMQVEKKPFKLSKTILDVKSMLSESIEKKNLYVDVSFADIPDIYIGDVNKIKQILINLISNAIKFTDHGGIQITCKIIEKIDQDHLRIAIKVKDTGIGMTKEQINQIFYPYEQANQSISRRYGGSGLGLVISKRFADLMKGTIYVESKINEGTTFTLVLPLEFDINDQSKKYLDHLETMKAPMKNAHILIAEDNLMSLKLAERILKNMGMKVSCAHDGLEALKLFEEQKFDLIILDLMMPKLNGIEVAKKIRKSNQTTPILALSAHTFLEDRINSLHAGMNDYIIKPFDQKSLYQALSHWIPETKDAT